MLINTEEPAVVQEEVLNVVHFPELHYYSNGSTLTMAAIYHEDGSIGTHTEFSYTMGGNNEEYFYDLKEEFWYEGELPSSI